MQRIRNFLIGFGTAAVIIVFASIALSPVSVGPGPNEVGVGDVESTPGTSPGPHHDPNDRLLVENEPLQTSNGDHDPHVDRGRELEDTEDETNLFRFTFTADVANSSPRLFSYTPRISDVRERSWQLRPITYTQVDDYIVEVEVPRTDETFVLFYESEQVVCECVVVTHGPRALDDRTLSSIRSIGHETFDVKPWQMRFVNSASARTWEIALTEFATISVHVAFGDAPSQPATNWSVAWPSVDEGDVSIFRRGVRVRRSDEEMARAGVRVLPNVPLTVNASFSHLTLPEHSSQSRFSVENPLLDGVRLSPGEHHVVVEQIGESACHILVTDPAGTPLSDAVVAYSYRTERGSSFYREAVSIPNAPGRFVVPDLPELIEIGALHPLWESRLISFTPNRFDAPYVVALQPGANGMATIVAANEDVLNDVELEVSCTLRGVSNILSGRRWRFRLDGASTHAFALAANEWVEIRAHVPDDYISWPDSKVLRGDRSDRLSCEFQVYRNIPVVLRIEDGDREEPYSALLALATAVPSPDYEWPGFEHVFELRLPQNRETHVQLSPGEFRASVSTADGRVGFATFELHPGDEQREVSIKLEETSRYTIVGLPDGVAPQDGLVLSGPASLQEIAQIQDSLAREPAQSLVGQGVVALVADSTGSVNLPSDGARWWYVVPGVGMFALELHSGVREARLVEPEGSAWIDGTIENWEQVSDELGAASVAFRTHTPGRPSVMGGPEFAVAIAQDGTFTVGPIPAGTYRATVISPTERGYGGRTHANGSVQMAPGTREPFTISVNTR